ncbi:hypothetical protein B7463_g6185, partial [Scytalidium lignicola]
MRIDKRFHIPNGSMGPGSYSAGAKATEESEAVPHSRRNILARINTEEEVYDDELVGDDISGMLSQKGERDLEATSDAGTVVEMEDTTSRS